LVTGSEGDGAARWAKPQWGTPAPDAPTSPGEKRRRRRFPRVAAREAAPYSGSPRWTRCLKYRIYVRYLQEGEWARWPEPGGLPPQSPPARTRSRGAVGYLRDRAWTMPTAQPLDARRSVPSPRAYLSLFYSMLARYYCSPEERSQPELNAGLALHMLHPRRDRFDWLSLSSRKESEAEAKSERRRWTHKHIVLLRGNPQVCG
jgi:hypothetical protein